jgi:hypothetical protein
MPSSFSDRRRGEWASLDERMHDSVHHFNTNYAVRPLANTSRAARHKLKLARWSELGS